ncbi:MAG TPA: sialidase, partial [Burkholderiaceae bacterium]|nr:sialidase [Burkholderiaceae bacterium]
TRNSLSAGMCLDDGRLLLASQSGELLLSRDGGRSFKAASNGSGLPVTAVAQTAGGRLALATMRGVRSVPLPASSS